MVCHFTRSKYLYIVSLVLNGHHNSWFTLRARFTNHRYLPENLVQIKFNRNVLFSYLVYYFYPKSPIAFCIFVYFIYFQIQIHCMFHERGLPCPFRHNGEILTYIYYENFIYIFWNKTFLSSLFFSLKCEQILILKPTQTKNRAHNVDVIKWWTFKVPDDSDGFQFIEIHSKETLFNCKHNYNHN